MSSQISKYECVPLYAKNSNFTIISLSYDFTQYDLQFSCQRPVPPTNEFLVCSVRQRHSFLFWGYWWIYYSTVSIEFSFSQLTPIFHFKLQGAWKEKNFPISIIQCHLVFNTRIIYLVPVELPKIAFRTHWCDYFCDSRG